MRLFKAACFIEKIRVIPLWVGVFAITNATLPPRSWATAAPQTEIPVTLLGQPCLLRGPAGEATLTLIHSFGPAQLYPMLSPLEYSRSKQQTKNVLMKLKNSGGLPSLLDRYRERLARRVEAQMAFLDSFEASKNTHTPVALHKIAARYLVGQKLKDFKISTDKLMTLKMMTTAYRDTAEQLFDAFNEGIEKDPEEDFHSAIKKLNVQYTCSFDESEEAPD